MGCSTSRLDHLPAVSLCHDRCKYLEEALYQSYALADAHVAYMHSLKALGSTLRRFFEQNVDSNRSHSPSSGDSAAIRPNPCKSSPSPDHCLSSSNSDSHLDFPSDSEDEESGDTDFDLLHQIHPNYFDRQTPTPSRSTSYSYREHSKYDYYTNNGGLFRSPTPYGASSPDRGSAWKTPSPPPPPSGSTWEFLNFFDTYERYELQAKDKEGIQELKDEFESKIHGESKLGEDSKKLAGEEKQIKAKLTVESGDVTKHEVHVAESKVILDKEKNKENKNSEESKNRNTSEVIKELEDLFEKAAESGNEILKILDTGKFRYFDKNSIYQGVYSKKLSFIVIPSKVTEKIGSVGVSFDEDLAVTSVNLSSIIKKLCMWERKLYDEVKAEEKLRIMLARIYRQMKNMGEKAAEANKLDSARTVVRTLSTKIKVSIQVIDRTSITISKLRDEELWSLINELIQKLLGMWKGMLECHRSQSQAVEEARSLDAIMSNGKFSETHLEAAMQLKVELQNWNLGFSNWIAAQRGYVNAVNGWLLKFLPNEPEEMQDGTPPVSPVERNYTQLQQRLTADKELEKRMKILEREEKRMQKVLQARGKKMCAVTGRAVHQSEMTNNNSLQFGLRQIFMAIEKFSAKSVQFYEELHVHVEESSLT
ncbi:protein ALTERED PHOSPHATE STARVATION RESPONSE 1 isoform X2 [Jatropha curcas]|uniref:protein ALTERED PHOSPHATE STARVATION RESPONSE 1 isoform X2 n=1 Tax=Jatropha curcas TaxID=180498 RepID=UPI0009D6C3E4|nr:protein ALTERED PHOSPHATE STARVATION RESPONSE 1 isoform X2 [Jatropha curcas]